MPRKAKHEKSPIAPDSTANRPVVIAVDFSDDSKAALEWGMEEAALRNAPATILHVVHDPGEAPGFYHKKNKKIVLPLTEVAEQLFDEFIDECSAENPRSEEDGRPAGQAEAGEGDPGSAHPGILQEMRCANDRHGQSGADRNQAPADGFEGRAGRPARADSRHDRESADGKEERVNQPAGIGHAFHGSESGYVRGRMMSRPPGGHSQRQPVAECRCGRAPGEER